MKSKLEKDVRFLKGYAIATTLVIGTLLLTAFQSSRISVYRSQRLAARGDDDSGSFEHSTAGVG